MSGTHENQNQLSSRIFWRTLLVLFVVRAYISIEYTVVVYFLWQTGKIETPEILSPDHWPQWLGVFSIYFYVVIFVAFPVSRIVSDLRPGYARIVFHAISLVAFCVLAQYLLLEPLDHWLIHKSAGEDTSDFAHFLETDFIDWLNRTCSMLKDIGYLFGIGFAIRYWMLHEEKKLRTVKLEQAVTQLRHEALCSRVQPHFLFNALNTISSLVNSDPTAARDAIGCLGTLLQTSLDTVDVPEIELRKEFELVEDYLTIQKLRYRDRLQFALELDQKIQDKMIPAFLLQPLVENSLIHGYSNLDTNETLTVTVSASKIGDRLRILVEDTGQADDQESTKIVERIGISVTKDRLEVYYQERASAEFLRSETGGFTVKLELPMEGIQ